MCDDKIRMKKKKEQWKKDSFSMDYKDKFIF